MFISIALKVFLYFYTCFHFCSTVTLGFLKMLFNKINYNNNDHFIKLRSS